MVVGWVGWLHAHWMVQKDVFTFLCAHAWMGGRARVCLAFFRRGLALLSFRHTYLREKKGPLSTRHHELHTALFGMLGLSRNSTPLGYYGLPITCRFFRTKRVRRLSNRNVAVRFSLFSLPIP